MYTSLGRQGDYKRPADVHARPEAVDFHEGDRHDFLRRHERAAAEAAQGGPQAVLAIAPYLFPRAADPRNLRIAWDFLKHCGGQSPGPNGHRYEDYEHYEVWEFVRTISKAMLNGTYRPGPVRKVRISKGRGRGHRTLTLMNIEDRVVQRGIIQVIQPVVDPGFEDFSYGFRPGRDRLHALAHAEALTTSEGRMVWVVEDLKDAFDRVPRNRLLDVVRKKIPDERMVQLIGLVIHNGTKRGLYQGGPLSPLLLNLYLDRFLDKVWKERYPDLPLLRTADDLLVLCRSEEEARKVHANLKRILTPTGMLLKHLPDTAIRNLAAGDEAEWLGFLIRQGEHGLEVRMAESTWDSLADRLLLAHLKPGSPLQAIATIQRWVDQLGPSFPFENRPQVYTQIAKEANDLAFDEIPSHRELVRRWQRAYARWCCTRKRTVDYGDTICGGSARHARFSAKVRRSDGPSSCGGPSLCFLPEEPAVLYTDGCCLAPSKIGGWAYIIDAPSLIRPFVRRGALRRTTNNRAELMAVIKGLESMADPTDVHVFTDSEYVALGITERLPRWKSQGWRAGSGRHRRPLKNVDLWQRLDALLTQHRVSCEVVRGHSGCPENDQCDRLARTAAEGLQRRLQEHTLL